MVGKLAEGRSHEKLKQVYFHFKKAVEVLSGLELTPRLFSSQASVFFQKAADLKIHPSYFPKVLRIINELGQFLCALENEPYQKIQQMDRRSRERLAQETEHRRGKKVAQPLSLKKLNQYRTRMLPAYYNYLYVTLFLGLRPSELDRMLTVYESWKVVTEDGIMFLDVYQGKLTSIAKESRWKRIPVYEPEQQEALRLAQSKQLKRPDGNEMRRIFGGEVKLYSGRKGFAALMLKRGWRFEDASKMLGHSSIRTTESYYINAEALRQDRAMSAVRFRQKKTL